MRITFLSHFPGAGGSTTLLKQIHDYFREAGHATTIVVGNDAPNPLLENYQVAGMDLKSPWRERMERYRTRVQETRPDLVYSISGWDEMNILRFLDCPRVRHFSSVEQHAYADIPYWLEQGQAFLEGVSANTPDIFDTFARFGLFCENKLIVPYRIDPRFIQMPELRAQSGGEGPVEVCFVGRLENFQKRALWLPVIDRECRGRGTQLIWHLYGSGPDFETLRTRWRGDAYSPVFFHGWTDADTLIEKLPRHDLFFLCSRWEGLPIAMMEAMLCGLACVVPAMPGGMEYILQQGGGWLYQATSPGNAAQALFEAVRNRDEIWRRRREAQRVARTLLNQQMVEGQFKELAHSLQNLKYNGRTLEVASAPRLRSVRLLTWVGRAARKISGIKSRS